MPRKLRHMAMLFLLIFSGLFGVCQGVMAGYNILVRSNPSDFGKVQVGSNTPTTNSSYYFASATTVTIKAIPNTGYKFVNWAGGYSGTSSTISIPVASYAGKVFQANFTIQTYTITFKNADGTQLQSLTVKHGETPTYTGSTPTKAADAQYTYTFDGWDPEIVAATKDAVYTAKYKSTLRSYTITLKTENGKTTQGTVRFVPGGVASATVSKTITYGFSANILASPATNYEFVRWKEDGNTSASRAITVTGAKTYTAVFAPVTYKITATSDNPSYGTVSGGGTYSHGSSATLTATPANCTCVFKQWDDGNTDNPRTVTVTGAKTYTAQFVALSGNCGTTGHEADVTWSLCTTDSTLTISGIGAMEDWGVSEAKPWEAYKGSITTVIVEDGVTNIGNCAFYNYKALTSVTLPESLEVIGDYAFYYCSALKSVPIPSHVTTIGAYAFNSCKALKSVTIPNSVTSIGMRAFANCPYIFDIYVSWTSSIPTCPYEFTTSNNPTLHVPCRTKDLYGAASGWKDYHIVDNMPNVKEGTWETNIHWSMNYCDSTLTLDGSGEFRCDYGMWDLYGEFNRYYVKRAVISKDITYLGIYTLSGCPNMEYIDVEAGNPTHRSGYNAIIRNGNGTEGDTLMFGCKNTVIPPTVTAIRGYAFWDSHKVTEMRIPASVNEIGNSNYPKSILWLLGQGSVFYTSDTEGEGLKDLYVEWMTKENIPVLKSNTLGDMTKVRLHVPCGTTALYKQVTGWKNFKEYIEEATSYTVTVQTATGDESMGTVSITVP